MKMPDDNDTCFEIDAIIGRILRILEALESLKTNESEKL